MSEYVVTWQVEVEADSPVEAAREALAIQRDRDSQALIFEVRDPSDPIGGPVSVDLLDTAYGDPYPACRGRDAPDPLSTAGSLLGPRSHPNRLDEGV